MTLVLRIFGGVDAKIETPFLIFKSRDCNYPSAGVPDKIQGACY